MKGIIGRRAILILALFLLPALSGTPHAAAGPEEAPKLLHGFSSFSSFPGGVSWKKTVPQVREISIESTYDGTMQPALYYDSGTGHPKPLLVALHSWSDNYRQRYSIPYALWAVANDWIFIHPDYRGVFSNPSATGSEQAVQDVLDAVEYARRTSKVDPSRVYLVGFSGGAMTALLMAGRHPEIWTAVSAWVPVFSLNEWYPYVTGYPKRAYARQIASACGGAPRKGSTAAKECEKRSPSRYLANARGKAVRIHIGHGIRDDYVPPVHSLWAYNELAEPEDRISEADIAFIGSTGKIPELLAGNFSDELYDRAGKPLVFRKSSGNATVSLFKGTHDVLYNAALSWLSGQVREPLEKTRQMPREDFS